MQIRNATSEQIRAALAAANEVFDGNLQFKRFDHVGRTRQGGEKHEVTLTVVSSRGPGARRSHSGRRIAAACFHAFGTFMDALPATCEIVTASPAGRMKVRPGDPWSARDGNIGSMWRPLWASDACDCEDF